MGVEMRRFGLGVTVMATVALVAACTSGPASPPTAASGTTATAAHGMAEYLDGLVQDHQFRGVVEVRRGDEVLIRQGFDQADVTQDVPNEQDTRFRIASLTKQFTGLAVLILQEQGKVKVSDLLCTHLPNCPATWRAITVEHLLTHTAGLYDYVEISGGDPERYATAFGPEPSPEQLIRTFVDRPLEFPPGTKHHYSSSGYVLLGALIERLSGETYGEFLENQILDPLDMSDTAYQPDEQANTHDAVGYLDWTTPATKAPDAVSFAGGGMYSTVTDLTRWNQFLLTGTPAIVKKDTLAQLLQPRVAAEGGAQYGYGIYTKDTGNDTLHGHPGGVPGFAAYNEIRPATDLSIVILSNLDTPDGRSIGLTLASLAS
jgi:CubicO group peptidase (beta-lactamase class C family)